MRKQSPVLLWAFVLSAIAVAVAALIVLPPGHAVLDRMIGRGEAVALLPGVTVEERIPPGHGLVVTSLRTDSEAARAGVRVGDGIATVDGHPVETLDRARARLHNAPGRRVTVRLIRDAAAHPVRLTRQGDMAHGA